MEHKVKVLSFLCIFSLVFTVSPNTLFLTFAQVTTGTVQGTVKDSQGAVIPGVEVTIRNLETGVPRTTITDDQGRYLATNLDLGTYEVRGALAGFQTAVRRGITLTIGLVAVVDLVLQIGEVTEEVVVTGEAPLVETTQSSIAEVVDERKIRELPLNGRSFSELALLQVGVTKVRSRGDIAMRTGVGDQLSFAGSRPDANTYSLDGADINNPYNKAPNSGSGGILGVEAVREFQVLTNTYSAQYGRSMGGQLIAVTRSGTNEFHGSVYEFHRNDNLDAANFFDRFDAASGEKQKPEFKRNQFGFALGGPIVKDKTFFFGNYEGFRERLGLTTISAVPDENARRGILPGRQPINVHPATQAYLANYDLYPLPNGQNLGDGRADYIFRQTQPVDEDGFMVRVDHNFAQSDALFVRQAFNDGERLSPASRANFGRERVTVGNRFTTLEERHIFSPKTLNTLRFSFNRSLYFLIDPELVKIPSQLWLTSGVNLAVPGQQPMGGIFSVSSGTFFPRFFTVNLFQWSDDVAYVLGDHSLKFGALAERIQYNMLGGQRFKGDYGFDTLEDFLIGRPRNFRITVPGSDGNRGMRLNLFGFYIQDDYQMRPGLTWNLGLRYEFITVPTEVNGKVANLHSHLDPQVTVGDPFFENPSLKNFAPRIGFAWDPFGGGRTSVRGGYGIYYNQILYNYWNQAAHLQPPFVRIATIVRPRFPDAFRDIVGGSGAGALQSVETLQGKFGQTYLQQWNLSIQRELFPQAALSVGYVATRGAHLPRIIDNVAYSAVRSDGRVFIPVENRGKRRNPNFGEIRQRTMDANSFYHGLVIDFKKRYQHGFNLQLSYTFSKAIDDASINIGASEATTETHWTSLPEDPSFDRGLSLFHTSHDFTLNGSWELPFGPGKPFAGGAGSFVGKCVGGWSISSIVTFATGSPLTPTVGIDTLNNGSVGGGPNRADLVVGRDANPVLGGPDRYFDPTAFALPETGVFGNLGRNTIIGPGFAGWDLSLVKSTPVSERSSVQFRAEFFNVFNRANFGTPSRALFREGGARVGSAGRITSTDGTSRQIQLALKFIW
ncbi:MAG: TonB-dependent receptor [Acidobacteria bacterium]|nr:TonB-dependent receptor [Acidobacteriota bacterium]